LQVNELEEQFKEQRRYGQSIRKIVKRKILGPKILPPLKDEDSRSAISKSVIVLGAGAGGVQENNAAALSQSMV
jgi:hypothetical protein